MANARAPAVPRSVRVLKSSPAVTSASRPPPSCSMPSRSCSAHPTDRWICAPANSCCPSLWTTSPRAPPWHRRHREHPCPVFEKFIRDVTCGDDELAAYLQRLFGYCLTGETSEEIFAFFYGGGCNGKSTLLNIIAYILGDYAKNAGMETFTQRRHEQEIARLAGARLVTASETEEGRQ